MPRSQYFFLRNQEGRPVACVLTQRVDGTPPVVRFSVSTPLPIGKPRKWAVVSATVRMARNQFLEVDASTKGVKARILEAIVTGKDGDGCNRKFGGQVRQAAENGLHEIAHRFLGAEHWSQDEDLGPDNHN